MAPHFDLLIREEEKKLSQRGYSKERYNSLKKMKSHYERTMDSFRSSLTNNQAIGGQIWDLQHVEQLRDELFKLKHSGLLFQQVLNELKDDYCKFDYEFPPVQEYEF